MSERKRLAQDLALDVDFETARAIHRIIRALHDGECPRCNRIFDSREVVQTNGDEACPKCGFTITKAERYQAAELFGPVMARSLELFEAWRKGL